MNHRQKLPAQLYHQRKSGDEMKSKSQFTSAFRSAKSNSARRLSTCRSNVALALFLSFFLSFSHSLSSEEHAPRIASYDIEVELDTKNKKLLGKEILTFKNTSEKSVDTLFFHLYPNAFRSDTTAFMKESLFPDRVRSREEHWGYVEIKKINLGSGYDLTDQKIIDETVMRLPLPEPLAPETTIRLEIEFAVKLPELLVRMGYSGNRFVMGQWFPKMAVL